MNTLHENDKKIAIVLSGGGARGAYEAGVIHFIRTGLSLAARSRRFDIHTGASVGAINACFMASTAHDLERQGTNIHNIWHAITQDDVYRRDIGALLKFLKHTAKSMVSNLSHSVSKSRFHYRGFLDTRPLMGTIQKLIDFEQIHTNIGDCTSGAIALVGTNVNTGAAELFIDKHPSVTFTGTKTVHLGPLGASHVMASTAIPIVFPPVLINQVPYIDGGLRLNTPLSPAIQLGADRILTIGLHHPIEQDQMAVSCDLDGCFPSFGQVLGRVMNTVFLDRTKFDVEQLQRINCIIDWAEQTHGQDFLKKINHLIVEKGIRGDIANRGLKRIDIINITPSKDIAKIFSECYHQYEDRGDNFSLMERFLTRGLDINPDTGSDFLSYLAFMPNFINTLLELGYQDAKRHSDELEALMAS